MWQPCELLYTCYLLTYLLTYSVTDWCAQHCHQQLQQQHHRDATKKRLFRDKCNASYYSPVIRDNIAGRSGRVVSASDCAVRGPQVRITPLTVVFIATAAAIYSLGHWLRTFTACPGRLSLLPLVGQ